MDLLCGANISSRRGKSSYQYGRHRWDSNPCGQSPLDFESNSLTTRTQCLVCVLRIPKGFKLALCHCFAAVGKKVTAVGFEPTPFRTSALSWRLRPLGHAVADDCASYENQQNLKNYCDLHDAYTTAGVSKIEKIETAKHNGPTGI